MINDKYQHVHLTKLLMQIVLRQIFPIDYVKGKTKHNFLCFFQHIFFKVDEHCIEEYVFIRQCYEISAVNWTMFM